MVCDAYRIDRLNKWVPWPKERLVYEMCDQYGRASPTGRIKSAGRDYMIIYVFHKDT